MAAALVVACLLSGFAGAAFLVEMASSYQLLIRMSLTWAAGDILGILIVTLLVSAVMSSWNFRNPAMKTRVGILFVLLLMGANWFDHSQGYRVLSICLMSTVVLLLAAKTKDSFWACLVAAISSFGSAVFIAEISEDHIIRGGGLALLSIGTNVAVMALVIQRERASGRTRSHVLELLANHALMAGGRAFAASAVVSLVILVWLNQISAESKRAEVKEVAELTRLELRATLDELERVQTLFTRQYRRRWAEREPGEEPAGWWFFSSQIAEDYKMVLSIEFLAEEGDGWLQEARPGVAGVDSEKIIHWRGKNRGSCVFTVDPATLLQISLQQPSAKNYSISVAGPFLPMEWRSQSVQESKMVRWSESGTVSLFGRQHRLKVTPRNSQALRSQLVDMRVATTLLLLTSVLIGVFRGQYLLVFDAEKRAVDALSARDKFLAVMSHEMRTPLVAIMGSAESLLSGVLGPVAESQGTALQRIYSAGEHYLALVDDMLISASIRSGHGSLKLALSSAKSICSDVVAMIQPSVLRKEQKLRVREPKSGVKNLVDIAKVRRILLNLLTNASKFTPVGGCLELHSTCTESAWRFVVRDNGPGIPDDQTESIFEPFRQSECGPSRSHSGVGLGLSIARGLANLHGGSLELASSSVDGCEFVLVLPVVIATAEAVANEESETPTGGASLT